MPFEPGASTAQFPALSIRQPWAELIVSGRKSIEVRTWATEYRGPLWIHTGQTENTELLQKFGLSDTFRGGFIGRVTLSALILFDRDRWDRWRERHLSEGPMPSMAHGWVLRDPIRLREPVRARGEVGLFKPSDDTTRTLEALLLKT